jgi:nicotinate-nucleotide pyrophosphorylase (carboxylating)
MKIEIEVTNLEEFREAIKHGADAILLDNMTPADIRQAVAIADGRVILEASGGIMLDNVRTYAETGVDIISIGALTHSACAVDISMEIESVSP